MHQKSGYVTVHVYRGWGVTPCPTRTRHGHASVLGMSMLHRCKVNFCMTTVEIIYKDDDSGHKGVGWFFMFIT